MRPLTILHLSDLHWSYVTQADLTIVIEALFADLTRLRSENDLVPDMVIFSGDLVQAGDNSDALQGAYDDFLLPLSLHTGVPIDRIYVAPGNHDISREEVRKIPSIQGNLKSTLTSVEAINRFLDAPKTSGSERELSLQRMTNFYDAIDSYHPDPISSSPFLRTYRTNIRGYNVGIACLNSSWRASGEADSVDWGNLIIGERAVDQARMDLSECDFKIAVHHHPLDWLVTADRQSIDFLSRKFFNLACSGHVHAARPFMSRDGAGTCITSQAGSIYGTRSWFNGYQFVQFDFPSRNYTFFVREYVDRDRRFAAATRVCDDGKVEFLNVEAGDPRRIDKVELFLRTYRDHLRNCIGEHLNLVGDDVFDANRHIADFVPPPIVKRLRQSLERNEGESGTEQTKFYSPSDLVNLENNIIIIGDPQCGKTSLAYFMAYTAAFSSSCQPCIPVYIDIRGYKFNKYVLKRSITNFYGSPPAGFDIDQALDEGLFAFFVDNLDPCEDIIRKLAKHSKEFNNNRWFIFASPNSDGVSPDRLFNEHLASFEKYHVKELTRGGIRALSRNWCHTDDSKEVKETYNAVMNQLIRDGLPRTPYMVSLLLWAIQQKKALQKINEAMLLSNIIDHLIGKADFRLARQGALNPVGKEITLQNLASFLKDSSGLATENDVTAFLIEFFNRKKLPFIGGDVLNKLVDCGVLKRDGEMISFKYRCFQDYFFAGLLKNDNLKLANCMKDLNFLDVRRELELLAGIRQQNDDLIATISNLLKSRSPKRFVAIDVSSFDDIATAELKIGTTQAKLGEIRRSRLTDDQVDEMMDEADRRALERGERPVSESIDRAGGNLEIAAKQREADSIATDKKSDDDPLSPSTHMAAIDTLARIVRNSDFSDYDHKAPATKLVLVGWVKIFLMIINEIVAILRGIGEKHGDPLSDDELHVIKYIMSKFLFNAAGSSLINQISSPTISDTLTTLISEGELSTGELILVLFILEDINESEWQERWSEVIKDRTRSGFVIECFVERLLTLSQTKSLDDNQAKRVSSLVDEIEKRLGWDSKTKSRVFDQFRDAVPLAAAREARR